MISIYDINIFWVIWLLVFVTFFFYILGISRKQKYFVQQTEYTPPKNINPVLAGFIIDGRFHVRDYLAGFVFLVQKNIIDVDKQDPKKIFFSGRSLNQAQLYIEEIALQEGYVKRRFSTLQISLYYIPLSLIVFIGFYYYIQGISLGIESFNHIFSSIVFLGSLPFSIFLVYLITGLNKPRLTEKGLIAKNNLLGFKKYLTTAESDRIDFFNHPKNNPDKFMEYLPYAIALGVDGNWNYKYSGLLVNPPTWYKFSGVYLPIIPGGEYNIEFLINKVTDAINSENKPK